MSRTSDRLRVEFKQGDDIRDAGLTTPADIVRYDDIAYGGDPAWQRLDVYRPKEAGDRLPVIVSIHGGGWVYGDKERYQYYCMSLAQRGFAVVNYTYRLAPEFKYPAAMEDANAVFGWVLEHAGEYGLDADRLFAVGDSAGAHMLALYACICTNPVYAATYPFKTPKGLKLTAISLACGVYDFDTAGGGLDRELMADLMPGGGTPEEMAWINPLNHITSDFPPTFAFTATGDYLSRQTPLLAAKLQQNDVPFNFRLFGDRANRLPHVFHCDMRSPDGVACNDEQCDFFKRFL